MVGGLGFVDADGLDSYSASDMVMSSRVFKNISFWRGSRVGTCCKSRFFWATIAASSKQFGQLGGGEGFIPAGPLGPQYGYTIGSCILATGALCQHKICRPDILGSFWDNSGIILGSFWGHSGVILGSFWDHSGVILGSFWGHSGVILGSLWDILLIFLFFRLARSTVLGVLLRCRLVRRGDDGLEV